MKKSILALSAALALSFTAPIFSQAEEKVTGTETYIFDKSHTNIMWFADHLGFSKSMGQFMDYDGEYVLNFDKPEESRINISIKTASVMTGLPKFDAHLKNADFFDVEKYPTADFKSEEIILKGENEAEVKGSFTMLGVTKPLTLMVKFNKRAMDTYANNIRTGFSVKTKIKRSEFGMNKYVPFVSDEIPLVIETEGLLKK